MSPAERVEALLALTQRLTARLDEQTRQFEACRPQDVAKTSADTSALAERYRAETLAIRADPSLVAGAPAARRAVLAEATKTFHVSLNRHAHAVKAAKLITEGLVETIAREVALRRPKASGYGPGALAPAGDARAVTLNRRA